MPAKPCTSGGRSIPFPTGRRARPRSPIPRRSSSSPRKLRPSPFPGLRSRIWNTAGRSPVAEAAALKSALGVLSRGPRHYVTITYNDHMGREQVAVFQLGTEVVGATIRALKENSASRSPARTRRPPPRWRVPAIRCWRPGAPKGPRSSEARPLSSGPPGVGDVGLVHVPGRPHDEVRTRRGEVLLLAHVGGQVEELDAPGSIGSRMAFQAPKRTASSAGIMQAAVVRPQRGVGAEVGVRRPTTRARRAIGQGLPEVLGVEDRGEDDAPPLARAEARRGAPGCGRRGRGWRGRRRAAASG